VGVSCIYVNNRKKSLKIHKKKDKRTNNDLYKNYAETRKSLKIDGDDQKVAITRNTLKQLNVAMKYRQY
jgi:hypothetical protein